jgi:hypothetical protein
MTKTEQLAENYRQSFRGSGNHITSMDIREAYENGAQDMLESILYFMRNFKDGNGNYPLYDYIGNVRNAIEE